MSPARACIAESQLAAGRFLAREPLVIAGLDLLAEIYQLRGGVDQLTILKHDGDRCVDGDDPRHRPRPRPHPPRMRARRPQFPPAPQRRRHLSPASYADAVAGTNCRVLDTRKTTPGLRALEKAGRPHRRHHQPPRRPLRRHSHQEQSHLRRRRSPPCARTRAPNPDSPSKSKSAPAPNSDEALAAGATHLLLDNLTPAEAAEWIAEIAGRAKVELSGGITLENVRAYAEAGADFVSSGAITHSARAVDISFRLELVAR